MGKGRGKVEGKGSGKANASSPGIGYASYQGRRTYVGNYFGTQTEKSTGRLRMKLT